MLLRLRQSECTSTKSTMIQSLLIVMTKITMTQADKLRLVISGVCESTQQPMFVCSKFFIEISLRSPTLGDSKNFKG